MVSRVTFIVSIFSCIWCICSSCWVLFTLGYQKGSKNSAPISSSDTLKPPPPIEVPVFSLDELKQKTDNFGSKALIGEGSYGRVYYATLHDGKAVAVKKLDNSSEPDSSYEFLSQVSWGFASWGWGAICTFIITILVLQFQLSTVSRLKHDNFVELLGYCVEGNVRILGYEFATMGSLHDVLHGKQCTLSTCNCKISLVNLK